MLMTQHLDEMAQEELLFWSGLRLLLFHQDLDELWTKNGRVIERVNTKNMNSRASRF
jgi:hypothetical protein